MRQNKKVVEAVGAEAKSKFTGHIAKVTVEVKEMKKAENAEAEKGQKEAAKRRCRIKLCAHY